VTQPRRLSPGEVLQLARSLRGQGRAAEAERAYRHALAQDPDNGPAALELGALVWELGRADEAEALLRRGLALEPDRADGWNGLGLALAGLGRLGEALEAYARAVSLDPAQVAARNNLGAALLASGRGAEAVGHFEAAIGLDPGLAELHNNLGNALAALGRPGDAVSAYARALALRPEFAPARVPFALALAALGRTDEAIAEFERAVAAMPTHAGAQAGLGRALAARERYEEAAQRLELALELGPATAELRNDLGAYLSALGRHEDAAAQFRLATELSPRLAAAHNNLGNALAALDRHAEAVAAYRAAWTLEPAFAEAYANMGSALAELHHPGDALPFFERALALNPHLAETHNNRAQAFVALGHMDDARDSFLRAISLKPERGEYYHGLARCTPLEPDDPQFLAMQALAANLPALGETDRIQLHFALAKAYEDQRRFEPAFAHLQAGNALRRQRIDYDEAATLARLRRFLPAFDAQTMRRAPPRGDKPDVPIFIVGMPRSGSTLVEQILASHASVFGGGELTYMAEEAARLANAPDLVARVRVTTQAEFAEIGERYRRRLQALAPGAPRITDKLPSNCEYLGLIRMALPNARILHTRRDPVDTCLSCFAQTFSAGLAFSNDLGELGRYYRAYADLMAQWRQALPEGAMLEVRYEDLVADFEPQVRRILDHCGLEWDARCLDFHETRRPVITASAPQVRRPIYQASSGRARAYGRRLQPLLDALGEDVFSESQPA
jgi:tetratricopeptide (TPR) repeat protein